MRRLLYRWHRRIGITSAVFTLLLALSGLLLLLEGPLGLGQKTWGGSLVSKVYKRAPKTEITGFQIAPRRWVVMVDGLVYVGDTDPIRLMPPLIGAGIDADNLVIFSNGETTILTLPDGRLVERYADTSFAPMKAQIIPKDIKADITARYSGGPVLAARVILDIHTGRMFGKIGPWVMGLASIFLILLSISGMIMWARKKPRFTRKNP